MTSNRSLASFSVRISGDYLVITQGMGRVRHTRCSLDLRLQPSFYLLDGQVMCRDLAGQEFALNAVNGLEANDLLTQLAKAQTRYGRFKHLRKKIYVAAAVAALALYGTEHGFLNVASSPVALANPQLASPVPARVTTSDLTAQDPTTHKAPSMSVMTSAADDGWALPKAVRLALPDKLHKAAERGLFTVDYSSGHARTLYVFEDPNCPNCQRLALTLNALSDAFNVVIFPVAAIGKEKSTEAITPVLCLPPEQRKTAWAALFDPAAGGLTLGNPEKPASPATASGNPDQPGPCDTAQKALGVNEVAYQAYRIPGTPWVISDDGRYVPQAVLKDPNQLQTFLNESRPQAAQEASNAAQ